MAAASDCTAVKKCSLQNTFMYVNHVRSVTVRKRIFFIIKINKFSMMKDNTSSTNPLPFKDWILNVSKNSNAVTLTLRTFGGGIYDVNCRVRYSDEGSLISTEGSNDISVNRVSDDKYVMYISSEIFHIPGCSSVLDADCLFCELHVVLARTVKINRPVLEDGIPRIREHKKRPLIQDLKETEEKALIQDLNNNLMFVVFADFKIKTKDSFRFVHKSVIAARSKFFFDYLKENPDSEEIELDTSIQVFDLMYDYIYYGEICPTDVPTTLALMKLAKKLQMMKLYELTRNFIMDSIDARNMQLIRYMGNIMGDDTLVSAADEILDRM